MTNLTINGPLNTVAAIASMDHANPVSAGVCFLDLFFYLYDGLICKQTMDIRPQINLRLSRQSPNARASTALGSLLRANSMIGCCSITHPPLRIVTTAITGASALLSSQSKSRYSSILFTVYFITIPSPFESSSLYYFPYQLLCTVYHESRDSKKQKTCHWHVFCMHGKKMR